MSGAQDLIPMVVMTGMFAMIFGIVYVRSRENMAMIEKGLNPRQKDVRPRPYANLKWGLLLIGSGLGLFMAYLIDNTIIRHDKSAEEMGTSITLGGHHSHKKAKVVSVADTAHAVKDTQVATTVGISVNDGQDDDGDEDEHNITQIRGHRSRSVPLYFSLIAIGGGLGLFFSYRIEKKEWLDKIPIA